MDPAREKALTLAHADQRGDPPEASDVVRRAEVYLDFLRGTRDAKILAAARAVAEAVTPGP